MIRIETFDSLDALRPWAQALADLNIAARRPSPFQTLEYFAVHMAHDEFARPGTKPLFLMAFDGEAPIGMLPMRLRPDPLFGLSRARLELLTTHDTDRPTIIARAEDEARCAEEFCRHIFDREHPWTMVELHEQDAASPLHDPVVDERRFDVRHFPTNPNATIELRDGFEAWYRSMNNFRSNLARRTRQLLSAGHVEFVATEDRDAALALLDLYLDLEHRSWKIAAAAGISRHPTRIAKFRAMLGPDQRTQPLFHWLVLDGVPIAGMLSLLFAGVAYQMELAFDSAYAALSPGNVTVMLGVHDAVARGAKAYNLLGNFAYHKARWNAVVTETHAVKIYRRGSLHHLRATAGDWRRRLFGHGVTQADVDYNLTKPDEEETVTQVDRTEARARAEGIFGALQRAGARIDRLDRSTLGAVLPFSVGDQKRAAAPARKPGRDAPRA